MVDELESKKLPGDQISTRIESVEAGKGLSIRNSLKPATVHPSLGPILDFVDGLVVVAFGALCSSAAVIALDLLLPGAHSISWKNLVDVVLTVSLCSGIIYCVSFSSPVWLGCTLFLLQLLSGVAVGSYAMDALCVWHGVLPAQCGFLYLVGTLVLTFFLCLLPAFSLPLYQALLESSRVQNTLASSCLDSVVSDRAGKRVTFRMAFKRSILQALSSFLYPLARLQGNREETVAEWLSSSTGIIRIQRPRTISSASRADKQRVVVRYQAFLQLEKVLPAKDKKYQSRTLSKGEIKLARGLNVPVLCSNILSAILLVSAIRFLPGIVSTIFDPPALMGASLFTAAFSLLTCIVAAISPFVSTWIGYFLLVVAGAIVLLGAIVICRPTHIELSKKGIRFLGENLPFFVRDSVLPWGKLKRIGLEKPKGKTSVADHWLVFYAKDGTRQRMRIGNLDTVAAREEILNAIERWAPEVPRDVAAITALQAPADYSYTEIWLEALSAPPERERLEPLIEGAVLKNCQYKVEKMLGSGGQGTAYLCEDVLEANEVVLKEFILPVFVDVNIRRKALATFEQEARLLKELSHPRIVKLQDYFVEDHRAYLVLEHINGKSLHQRVKENGPLSEEAALDVALQMCDILEYLASAKPPVVHRDFTPDNLIFNEDGVLKLIDFNVAHQENSDGTTGSVVGKPSYMAPEQFRGQPGLASDVYSMGASLFYVVTGEDPTPISESHPLLSEANVSAEFDDLISKMTAPEVPNRAVLRDVRHQLSKLKESLAVVSV